MFGMRILMRLVMKLVTMLAVVVIMAGVLRYGRGYFMKAAGLPQVEAPQFSSDETDLMSTVFKSALRLFSGTATRKELSGELSDKLYAGRDKATMSELGIELVKPGDDPAAPSGGANTANPNSQSVATQPGAPAPVKRIARTIAPPAGLLSTDVRLDLLSQIGAKVKPFSLELGMVPIAFLGMVLVHRVRRRRSQDDGFVVPALGIQTPAESEVYEMKSPVHSLTAEEFELLVALIYQRQGCRVSMPSALSGGRGGDFTLLRKSVKTLVQCKKSKQDQRISVDRVREFHEAMTAAGAARGMYVASCGFTWDARNFAKTKGMMLINARTLDEQIIAARENPNENLLEVPQWAPKFMIKVQLTTPQCPACEAPMVQLSDGAAWVCSQRPDCKGRRIARKYGKPAPAVAAAPSADKLADAVNA
jgi:hypothetical protein